MTYDPRFHHRKSTRLKGYDYSQEGLYFVTICLHERECLFGNVAGNQMILNDAGKNADDGWLQIPAHFPHAVLHEHIIMPNHVHGIIELTPIIDSKTTAPPVANTTTHTAPTHDGSTTVGARNCSPNDISPDIYPNVSLDDVSPDGISSDGTPPIIFDAVPPDVGAKNLSPDDISPIISNSAHSEIGAKNFSPLRGPEPSMAFRSPSKTIGSIVRGFKIGVTNWFRENMPDQFPQGRSVWQRNYHDHIIRDERSYHTISQYIIDNPSKWKDDKFFRP